ncbi:MAG: hypothetical protein S4CHLAM45_07110 [Chlamydiales bacterium]|nr:hypothetical protein [Chlamydiales bacterium]MCH9620272.1 hypothetical protein [Chlamydiales bacterium]MCH9622818.1 hypothetical protein [Chlamydiales bacterium]
MSETKPPKVLFFFTLFGFVALIFLGIFFLKTHLPDSIVINTKGQPTIGYTKSLVHIVVFEEPKCSNCKEYNNTIFPKIKKTFIDTHLASYTSIPVSFLPGSMPAAVALLCVYYGDPLYPNNDLFFAYLDYMYEHQPKENTDWATTDQLLEFASKASPAIETEKLRKCIDRSVYRSKIAQNTDYGKKVMGGRIMTPTVYVNGIEVKELTFESISDLIEKVSQNGGKP